MKKRVLNKWMIFFNRAPLNHYPTKGWREIEFGIIKLKSFPLEGHVYERNHYKGFWINFSYWLPWEITTQ